MKYIRIIGPLLLVALITILISLIPVRVDVEVNRADSEMRSAIFIEPDYTGLHTVQEIGTTTEPIEPEPVTEYAHVTAYSEYDSCHHANCVMANGIPAQVGYVACPRALALGDRVVIGETEYICGDRTAERFDGRYDIFMGYGAEAYAKAIRFGIREMSVRVLK